METLEERFYRLKETKSDINEHMQTLFEYAAGCNHVVEFGTRAAVSTTALLYAKPTKLFCYDLVRLPDVDEIERLAVDNGVDFQFFHQDTSRIKLGFNVDMLFIDTRHTYDQLAAELGNNAAQVTGYIVLHDVVTYGERGEDGGEGLLQAMKDFLPVSEWDTVLFSPKNNGLIVLKRKRL